MILSALLIATAGLGQSGDQGPAWAARLLAAEGVTMLTSAPPVVRSKPVPQPETSSQSRDKGGVRISTGVDKLIAVTVEGRVVYDNHDGDEANHSRKWAAYYARQGDLAKALKVFELYQSSYPDAAAYVTRDRIMIEYLLGERKQAYADLLADFRSMTPGEARPWLLLAATSASNGRTYPGELEYCEKAVRPDPFLPERDFPMPRWSAKSPKDIEAAACLANASEALYSYGSSCLERAWQLSPSSPTIGGRLANSLERDGRFTRAKEIERDMLKMPLTRGQRAWVLANLEDIGNKPDVPPKKPVFKDGGA